MTSKQSLVAALLGVVALIAMAIVAVAGDRHAGQYADTQWQEPSALIPVGHAHALRDRVNFGREEDDDSCDSSMWSDDDCQPFAGYESQVNPSRITSVREVRASQVEGTTVRTIPLNTTTPQGNRLALVLLLGEVAR
jgi:hypothetical protein